MTKTCKIVHQVLNYVLAFVCSIVFGDNAAKEAFSPTSSCNCYVVLFRCRGTFYAFHMARHKQRAIYTSTKRDGPIHSDCYRCRSAWAILGVPVLELNLVATDFFRAAQMYEKFDDVALRWSYRSKNNCYTWFCRFTHYSTPLRYS